MTGIATLFARDSQLWNVLMTIGAVSLALSLVTNPAEYGIPASFVPYLRLISLVMTIIGGKNSNSLVPHSKEIEAKAAESGK